MKLLIVVDVQNDFVTGSLGTLEAQEIIPNIKNKIKSYIDNGNEVVYTMDTHDDNYMETQEGKNLPVPHCKMNTDGWKVCQEIENGTKMHISKRIFGYLEWRYVINQLEDRMNATIDSIELVGLCTDICVVSNALILKTQFPEIPIYVDASCCAGVTPEKHKAALETMRSCQIKIIND